MLVGTAIAVSTGRIADPTRTMLPYLGRNCDSVKVVIVLICLAIYGIKPIVAVVRYKVTGTI